MIKCCRCNYQTNLPKQMERHVQATKHGQEKKSVKYVSIGTGKGNLMVRADKLAKRGPTKK